jgi:hypothetical protein
MKCQSRFAATKRSASRAIKSHSPPFSNHPSPSPPPNWLALRDDQTPAMRTQPPQHFLPRLIFTPIPTQNASPASRQHLIAFGTHWTHLATVPPETKRKRFKLRAPVNTLTPCLPCFPNFGVQDGVQISTVVYRLPCHRTDLNAYPYFFVHGTLVGPVTLWLFRGELCQMADIPLAVKPVRAIATSGTQLPKPPPPRGPARVEKYWSP